MPAAPVLEPVWAQVPALAQVLVRGQAPASEPASELEQASVQALAQVEVPVLERAAARVLEQEQVLE